MQLKIDDNCQVEFKKLKFEKKYRYIIYKIDKKQVVHLFRFRLLKKLERRNKIGEVS